MMKPPRIASRATSAVANNQRAMAQQATAGGMYAGQGLSRGRGQLAIDSYRDDLARAAGQSAATQVRTDDLIANQGLAMQDRSQRADSSLQGRMLNDQVQQSRWDNRFGNITTAWGVLAGLLR